VTRKISRILRRQGCIYFTISIAVLAYSLLFVGPFCNEHHFLDDNTGPDGSKTFMYFVMTTPVLIAYTIYAITHIGKTMYSKPLNYPLTLLNIYILVFLCLAVKGGVVEWLFVAAGPFLFISLPTSVIFGIINMGSAVDKRAKRIS
jgi:hypothetical protein